MLDPFPEIQSLGVKETGETGDPTDMCDTSKRLAFCLVQLWLSTRLRSEYCTGIE
jgi:hypothetical protein